MAAAANVKFIDRSYGKASVKMLHVVRDGNLHSIKEYEVTTLITLASDKDFTHVRFFFQNKFAKSGLYDSGKGCRL